MAFPSNQGSHPNTLAQALTSISAIAGSIKSAATTLRASSVAGPVSSTNIIAYVGNLAAQRDQIAVLAATPGLAQYAKDQYANSGLDIAAEYTALIARIDATVAWVTTNHPKAGSGEILERKWLPDGRTQSNTFDTAALATFRAQLDLLIAQID